MQKSVAYTVIQNSIYVVGMFIFMLPLLAIYLLFCPYFWGNDDYGMIDYYDYLNGFDSIL